MCRAGGWCSSAQQARNVSPGGTRRPCRRTAGEGGGRRLSGAGAGGKGLPSTWRLDAIQVAAEQSPRLVKPATRGAAHLVPPSQSGLRTACGRYWACQTQLVRSATGGHARQRVKLRRRWRRQGPVMECGRRVTTSRPLPRSSGATRRSSRAEKPAIKARRGSAPRGWPQTR